MEAELRAELTANIDKLKVELNKANRELVKYGKVADTTNKTVQTSFGKGQKSVANATPTLLEFNRVIQDAPFGIQGVANNITQLTQNFGSLQKSAGGTSNALRLLLSSFVGPAGVLFAVSAGTSLLVSYGDELFKNTSLSKRFADASKDIVGSVQSEVIALQSLVNIASNENLSRAARERAVARLNDKYGKYLGNLDLELIKTKEVKNQINLLTESLLKNAQARGAQALIQSIYNDRAGDYAQLLQEQRQAASNVESEVGRLTKTVAAFSSVDTTRPLTEQIKQIEGIINAYGGQGSSLVRVLSSNIAAYNKSVAATKEFGNETRAELEPVIRLFEQLTVKDILSEFQDLGDGVTVVGGQIGGFLKDSGQKVLGAITAPLETEFESMANILDQQPALLDTKLTTIENRFAGFQARLAETTVDISGSISSGFATIGQSLAQGESIIGAVGQGILSTIGGIATQLGQATIAAGVAGIALQNLFSSPYGAIIAGGALVAIGAALSSARGAVDQIGTGSIGGQGSRGFSGGSGSFSSSGGSFSSPGEFVFRINGQDLVAVFNKVTSNNQRLGGG